MANLTELATMRANLTELATICTVSSEVVAGFGFPATAGAAGQCTVWSIRIIRAVCPQNIELLDFIITAIRKF